MSLMIIMAANTIQIVSTELISVVAEKYIPNPVPHINQNMIPLGMDY